MNIIISWVGLTLQAYSNMALILLTILAAGMLPSLTGGAPNILFMMADQMRADAMGCSGSRAAITPNIDSLAKEGVRFVNAFSSTPTCTPARSALLTGLSPWYHGMLGYGSIAHRYDYEMPRVMSENGYYTHSIGKDHFGWNKTDNSGISHGYNSTYLYDGLEENSEFDDYDHWFSKEMPGVDPMKTGLTFNDYRGRAYALPEYYHPTAWVGRAAVDFIQNYSRSEPFFLKVSFHRPHSPYDPPQRWLDKYDKVDLPLPYQGGNWDERYAVKYNNTPSPGIWCGDLGSKQVRDSRQAYFASVSFVDEWIGEILSALEKKDLTGNTVIIFTADHGDMMGDHYHWRKGYPYYGSAHIPMLLRWPDTVKIVLQRGSTLSQVTELRDIFPTVLDFAEIEIPEDVKLNGSSVMPLLLLSKKWREYIDLEHDICYNATNHWNALTDGHTKYIFQAYFGNEQLFDLDNDPGELHDLSSDPSWSDTLLKWRGRLVKQFKEEGRGSDWVVGDKLMQRVKGQLYSPNYPH